MSGTVHFSPEELAQKLGVNPQTVIRNCVRLSVPIFRGEIDMYLYTAALEAEAGQQMMQPQLAVA